ncbi:MAG: TIGR01777 family protein [Chloroflexi bacterium]|nr:TIGR01777 family protein [Chloroflexota bacterium]
MTAARPVRPGDVISFNRLRSREHPRGTYGMSRRIVVAGGAGHIGRRLAAVLLDRGDDVIVLSRHPERATRSGPIPGRLERWSTDDPSGLARILDGADAVVGVTGVPVGPLPWTRRRRTMIRASRLVPTRAIVDAIRLLPPARRPRVLVSVSGTDGYEGQDQLAATEATPTGHGFLADLGRDWEAAAGNAEDLGVRVAITRIGYVLSPDATTMRLFALPFRLGLGGPLGSGRQWFSWVHIEDVLGLLMLAIDDPRHRGPINAVSPEPARAADVAAAIGAALHRPSWLPMPAALIRLIMRESSILALGSRRIVPAGALALGYRFRWTDLRAAMADVLRPGDQRVRASRSVR